MTLLRLQAAVREYLDTVWSDPKDARSIAIIEEVLAFATTPLATVGRIEANEGAVVESDAGLFTINSMVFHVRPHILLVCF